MEIMGIDVGTSGCKVAVFDLNGNLAVCAHREYPLIYPSVGAMELDPNRVWESVCACLQECGEKHPLSRVTAVAVSSQGEAIIPVDGEGRVLCNAPVTFDSRNEEEYLWFSDRFDHRKVLQITGAPVHPMFSATKILWLKNKYPELYRSAWKIFCFSDFIAFRLGAAPCMDASLASRTLLFDISEKKWSQPLLQGCGIEESKLPESVPCGQEIGKVSAEIAQRFGFSFGCGIVSGGHDQLCCSLGAGVLKSGELMDSLGTTESMVCVNDRLVLTEDMAKNSIPCSVYPVNGLYAYMTFLTGCGSLLRWLKENLFCSNDENFYYYFDDNVEKSYNGPSEVTILPYFSGAGTPRLDFRARGSITGLTLDTNRRQIYQAMMEATCLEEKWNLDNMERCGVPAEELRCIGGGSRSRIWLQIKADVTGHRVLSLRIGEAGCLGAAILAGLGHGVFRTAEEAVAQYVKVREEFRPDPEKHEKYQEKMECYLRLYSSGNL